MEDLFTSDLLLLMPALFLMFCLLLLMVYAVFSSVLFFSRFLMEDVTVAVSFVLFLLLLLFLNQPSENWKVFNFYFGWESLSNFFMIFVLFISIILLLISRSYFYYEELFTFEFGLLFYFYMMGAYLLFLSNDFFSLYLAMELQSFVLYVLCAFKRDAFSSEAGLKYFVLGAFSSGLLLFGMSLVYGFTGTTSFDDIYSLFLPSLFAVSMHNGFLMGLVFFTVGFMFKLGVFPFHMWVPDVYEGSPTIVTTILATLSKFIIAAVFIKIYVYVFFFFSFYWYRMFLIFGLSSVIFASVAALYQEKMKSLLAYSGMAHMGYVLLAISSNTMEGLFSAYYYLFVYALTALSIFTMLLGVSKYTNFLKLKSLSEFSSLFRSNPAIALSFSILLFSLAGIPPLAGFFSKLFVFLSLMNVGSYFSSVMIMVTSVVSAFYYLWIMKIIFFKDYPVKTYFVPIGLNYSWVMVTVVGLNIFVILFQNAMSMWLMNLIFSWYF